MKLSKDAIISREKLKNYLLTLRKRNDKSKWLEKAGYNVENWEVLENDIRQQILTLNAVEMDKTKYGQLYEIRGKLIGPNSRILPVCTIWMKEIQTGITKFITMWPDKRDIGEEKYEI